MPSQRRLGSVMERYPALAPYADRYDVRDGAGLEFYQQGEPDSPNPKAHVLQAPVGAPASDIAGEIVSHDLVNGVDPALTENYREFWRGLTPDQQGTLSDQYDWYRQNEGETRPFEQWLKYTGLPAYYRGYLFDQWDNPSALYTDGQMAMFDKTRRRLQGAR